MGSIQKQNNKACLLIFWDYDTQWGADRSRSAGGPKNWGELEFENTERLLEIHAEYDIPSCFAVVGAAALPGNRPYHDMQQIRRIYAAGHEIGSHAFRHEWLPGLNKQQLFETLHNSKEALEQCIGAPVYSFVPPYNQPYDYLRGTSISLSERREVSKDRTNLRHLCEGLSETGYKFCRVAYRPIHQRLAELFVRRRLDRPSRLKNISGIACVRLNTPCGFDEPALRMLDQCVEEGGMAVVYGHPHSIKARCPQNESYLITFLQKVADLRRQGKLEVKLPAQLLCIKSEFQIV